MSSTDTTTDTVPFALTRHLVSLVFSKDGLVIFFSLCQPSLAWSVLFQCWRMYQGLLLLLAQQATSAYRLGRLAVDMTDKVVGSSYFVFTEELGLLWALLLQRL